MIVGQQARFALNSSAVASSTGAVNSTTIASTSRNNAARILAISITLLSKEPALSQEKSRKHDYPLIIAQIAKKVNFTPYVFDEVQIIV